MCNSGAVQDPIDDDVYTAEMMENASSFYFQVSLHKSGMHLTPELL